MRRNTMTKKTVNLSVEQPGIEMKTGIKTSEFWATGVITGVPLVGALGYFDKEPMTELGEMAAWIAASIVVSTYIFCRSWLKRTEILHGDTNEKTTR
tara:strand:- start:790 stop:1080 length:291 start_codon:yes stop_codon:yes gene_type:complete